MDKNSMINPNRQFVNHCVKCGNGLKHNEKIVNDRGARYCLNCVKGNNFLNDERKITTQFYYETNLKGRNQNND